MRTIEIIKNKIMKTNPKVKEWEALAKKYEANELHILEEEETFPSYGNVVGKIGFWLEWHTTEDNIHVFGDGKGDYPNTIIKVDEATYLPESIKKLQQAIKCYTEIEANRKKYYVKPDKTIEE